jgi:hypothetical protein
VTYLFHVDGRLPNLALMRLSTHLKATGVAVTLVRGARPRTLFEEPPTALYGSYPRKVLLLDNDFFGAPGWADVVDELVAGRFRVCFSQGINLRQVDDRAANALARLEYRDNEFQTRTLYTAWDNLGDERVFKVGVETLRRAGVPPKHLRVYILVGYAKGETWEQIHHRFNELVALGCEPYPMVYEQSRGDLKAFQRWAVRGLYRVVPWREYRDPRLAISGNEVVP